VFITYAQARNHRHRRSGGTAGGRRHGRLRLGSAIAVGAATALPRYAEGPLIYAEAVLCETTGTAADCHRSEEQKANSLKRFGYLLDFSPQYDAIYLQWLLALYGLNHDRTLYAIAADNARNVEERARNGEGLYLLACNGQTLSPQNARAGMLQTHAATTSLFAWLAVYQPPA